MDRRDRAQAMDRQEKTAERRHAETMERLEAQSRVFEANHAETMANHAETMARMNRQARALEVLIERTASAAG